MEDPGHPVGGVDYVGTFQELDDWFAREVKCREYIRRLRWLAGVASPNRGMTGESREMARRRI
jgi:hypothetical protein